MMPARRGMAALLHKLLLACLVFGAGMGLAWSKALTTVRAGELPALETTEVPLALVSLTARPIAVMPTSAWQLKEDNSGWTQLAVTDGGLPANLVATIGDGNRAFLLSGDGDGGVSRVQEMIATGNALQLRSLPAMEGPLQSAQATVLGGNLYLAGLATNGAPRLLQLELNKENAQWSAKPGWPGAAQPLSMIAQTAAVFMVVQQASGAQGLLRWKADEGWKDKGPLPGTLVSNAARATGQAHILYALHPTGSTVGAPATLMTYQTITSAWAAMPGVDIANPIVLSGWKDGLVWARVGATPGRIAFSSAQIEATKVLLGWLDWVVIIVYLGGMIGIGLYFYLRERRNVSTANFFVGGRSIPFWAAGISLYATNTSSISFIAIPAKAFETNWQYLTNNLIAVFGLMFVATWIVPVLRRLDLMSVFSYLETRFHPAIRMLASALCIAMQIGSRMSVILFLPALAIATITGIDVVWSILIMGGFTILYTALGGMKAVIWTDFVQMFVMMGGALFAIGFIVFQINGGLPEFVATAMAEDKTHLLDFSFDLTKATVWGFIFLVVFDVVLTFPKDQVLMQRVLSTKSAKEAGRSIWAMAAIMIPGGFVFYGIGTALFVYYKENPERMNPLLPIDATFPLFIAAELPMGITGLIIAGIFAAAMSTLSSIINSVATLASVDFYEKLVKNPTPKQSVRFAEWMTVAVGLVGIGLALLLSTYDIHSLFDVSIELAGLLGGGFAGAYTLGMFTRRANSAGVAIGIGSSIVLTLVAWSMDLVHPYFYLAISIMLCIVIGYLASLFFPAPKRSLAGLTIYPDHASD
ncbi:MAG: sodium:solute symporter [Gammaproteobacteria bacterium RIFCSPHIGHO2_12_FULL_63_22]|nr:MAG: sodium:solute symporter [Gammaproteobacteria bacterium RIFCSPHIGHO2_12_FULL_63_22]